MAAKNTPDPLVRFQRDGEQVKRVIAEGTPLARLQSVFDDPESGVLAGDIKDVCNACDQKDSVVARLVKVIEKKPKGEKVQIEDKDVEYVTNLLVSPRVKEEEVFATAK